MGVFNVLGELSSALRDTVTSTESIRQNPSSINGYIERLTAASTFINILLEPLKNSADYKNLVMGGQIVNAVLVVKNLETQDAALKLALQSGNQEQVIQASLDYAQSVAAFIGAVPSPIAPEAKALALLLTAVADIYKNRDNLTPSDLEAVFHNLKIDVDSFIDHVANGFLNLFLPNNLAPDYVGNSYFFSAVSNSVGATPDPQVKIIRYVDPLILDLDGNGIKITPLYKNILFDANGDLVKTGTAWTSAGDGMLVLDRNANGLIDSGQELFGDETLLANGQKAANGFAALSELDVGSVINGVTEGAGDGIFDVKDAQFSEARIWQDLNQDGISQASELFTLADAGITSISLTNTALNKSYGDAILTNTGTFERTDGSTGQAGSFILAQNNFIREFVPVTVSEAAKALPNILGSGWVRDLQEAATINPELIDTFNQATDTSTRAEYRSAIENLIREWGNDSGYENASKAALDDGYGLILSGPQDSQEEGWMDIAIKASETDRNAYRATLGAEDLTKFDAMRERMVGKLEKLYAYEAFTGYTFVTWDKVYDDAVQFAATGMLTMAPPNGMHPVITTVALSTILGENRIGAFSSEEGYIVVNIPTPTTGGAHLDVLWDRIVDDVSYNLMPMLRLDDYLDQISLSIDENGLNVDFTNLNQALDTAALANAHEGATLLLDLYHLYGSSFDSIGWNGAEQLRALMQQASTDTNIRSAFSETDLHYFSSNILTSTPYPTAITDGTISEDVFAGNAVGNTFYAEEGDDFLDGQAGNDNLHGGLGNDMLFGGSDNDHLYGEDGADTLVGEAGNDTLSGGSGNDTYVFGLGDGQDYISYTYSISSSRVNVLEFKEGISVSDISVKQAQDGYGHDLVLSIIGTTDKVTIANYFFGDTTSNAYSDIQQIKFADGTIWKATDVLNKLFAGTTDADNIKGTTASNLINGQAGNDSLNGVAGNDTIDGGAGDDGINGGDGNDLLLGGDGNDYLAGDAGADTIDGGAGNDALNSGAGNDTYLFGLGDGQDYIQDRSDYDVSPTNTLKFKAGVLTSDITLKQLPTFGVDLKLGITGTTDSITISNFIYNDAVNNAYADVQTVVFDDGTIWDTSYILNQLYAGTASSDYLYGTSANNLISGQNGNDTINGASGHDTIQGDAGNDELWGGSGNDLLLGGDDNDGLDGGTGNDEVQGGAGVDTVSGGDGEDTLDGGAGNDELSSDAGNDTYLFGIGDGQDFIRDSTDNNAARVNTLQFKDGVLASNVVAQKVSNGYGLYNLQLSITGTTDKITVSNYFYNDTTNNLYSDVQLIKFADGTIWDANAVTTKVFGATNGNDNIQGNAAANTFSGLLGNDTLNGAAGDDTISGDGGNDSLLGGDGNDSLLGGDGNDTADGGNGNDIVFGDIGNDSLFGGAGIDTLDGGAGNDVLSSGAGNDTYLFGRGDGQDFISDSSDTDSTRVNTLQFKDGVAITDVIIKQIANTSNLQLSISGTTDKVTISNFFFQDNTSNLYTDIQLIKFADGTTWDATYIKNTLYAGSNSADWLSGTTGSNLITGQLGNDTIFGVGGNDTLQGNDGDDSLDGGVGNDLLQGGAGNDYLFGNDGIDTLEGGAGNDTLVSAAGNDTYLFGRGDGQDFINDSFENDATRVNTLLFKSDVLTTDITLKQISNGYGYNLQLSITGTTDKVTVSNYLYGDVTNNLFTDVQLVKFDDGTTWDATTIMNKLFAGTNGADLIQGTTASNVITGLLGNDTINGAAGHDSIDGGVGNDSLQGSAGNDTLIGGSGNDTLEGGAGNDVYYVDSTLDVVTENASEGTDTVNISIAATGTYTLGTNIENATLANAVNYNLTGNASNNLLIGNAYANSISGGTGNDTIDSGAGNDSVTGGTGQDIFKFSSLSGFDAISDFSVVDDTVSIDKSVFAAFTTAGTVAAGSFISGAGLVAGQDADDYLVYDSTTGSLYYDADGSGAGITSVKIAQLTSGLALTNADFLIV